MTTINDVAKLANVSKGTVSRVLNNVGYFSEDTKQKVLLAAKELNYTPNKLARQLSLGKTGKIAVMYPYGESSGIVPIIRGITIEAKKQQKEIVLYETNFDLDYEKKIFNLLHQKLFDALIIISCATPENELNKYNKNDNIVLCQENDSNISSVYSDFNYIFEKLILLIKRKNKKIGIVIGNNTMRANYEESIFNFYRTLTNDVTYSNVLTNCSAYEYTYKYSTKFTKQSNPPNLIVTDGTLNGAAIKKAYINNKLSTPIVISLYKSSIGKYADLLMIDLNLCILGRTAFNLIGSTGKKVKIKPTFDFKI